MNSKLSISSGQATIRKLFMLFVVGLILQLCALPVGSTLDQRIDAHREATSAMSKLFGGITVISHPLLVVPLLPPPTPAPTDPQERPSGPSQPPQNMVLIAKPAILNTKAHTTHQIRKRGIYEFPIFTTEVVQEGVFDLTHVKEDADTSASTPDWSRLDINLSSLDDHTIMGAPALIVNGRPTPPTARSRDGKLGLIRLSNFSENQSSIAFTLTYTIRGTQEIIFPTSAGQSTTTFTSSWPHPSFTGDVAPLELVENAQGFTAVWTQRSGSLSTTRITEAEMGTASLCCDDAVMGASFISPVDVYRMTTRAYTYDMLFVVLVFTCFYLFEVIIRVPIHPIQYGLVGAALAIFFLLLLALAEHLTFWLAYAAAAATATTLVTGYSRAILRIPQRSWLVFCMMSALYTFLFLVLRSEDFALLLGTTAVTITLALLMYLTRNINWYERMERVETAVFPPAAPTDPELLKPPHTTET